MVLAQPHANGVAVYPALLKRKEYQFRYWNINEYTELKSLNQDHWLIVFLFWNSEKEYECVLERQVD